MSRIPTKQPVKNQQTVLLSSKDKADDSPTKNPKGPVVKVNRLGTISETGSGAVPDDFAKKMGTHGYMRMTTADFDEQKDLVTISRKPKIVHLESVERIAFMGPGSFNDIQHRIEQGDEYSAAHARQSARNAIKEEEKMNKTLAQSSQMINQFLHNDPVMKKYKTFRHTAKLPTRRKKRGTVPIGPNLMTPDRAQSRGASRFSKVERYNNDYYSSLPHPGASKHEAKFNLDEIVVRYKKYDVPSVHEPPFFANSIRRSAEKVPSSPGLPRARPQSAMGLGGPRKSMVGSARAKKFTKKEMNHQVSRLYDGTTTGCSANCNGCYEGEAKHWWPLQKKVKYGRPWPFKVLQSLYGSRSGMIKVPEKKEKKK